MLGDTHDEVDILVYPEIKSVVVIHSGLPAVLTLAVFLRPQRGVAQISEEVSKLFVGLFLQLLRQVLVLFERSFREQKSHRSLIYVRFFSAA